MDVSLSIYPTKKVSKVPCTFLKATQSNQVEKKTHYLQTQGTAVGTRMAPSYTNLNWYIHCLLFFEFVGCACPNNNYLVFILFLTFM